MGFPVMRAAGDSAAPVAAMRIEQGTSQQEALWGELAAGSSHVLVEARAGSGKSSSCREGMWRMMEQSPGLRLRYAVFGNDAAKEFRADCPPGVDVTTLHSLGFAALRRKCNSRVDKLKSYLILDEWPLAKGMPRYRRRAIALLVGHAKNQGYDVPPAEKDRVAWADYCDSLQDLLIYFDVTTYNRDEEVCSWAARVLARSAALTEVVDFDDMLWLPPRVGATFPTCDVLFIDECQDLNRAQHDLIPLIADSGRVIAVGDRYQSIYAFRGADCDSIPNLEKFLAGQERGLAVKPLTVTFRCPVKHVEVAQRYVHDIQARDNAPLGIIEHAESVRDAMGSMLPGDMVLCAKNAPVISAALRMIKAKRPAFVRGRNIGESLTNVLRLCSGDDHRTIAPLAKEVEAWRRREVSRLSQIDGMEDVIDSVYDRAAGLQAILSVCDSPADVRPLILELFSDDMRSQAICFSTIHRAKGLEATNVWLLDCEQKKAARAWEAEQQRNLSYVSVTRAKNQLVYVQA